MTNKKVFWGMVAIALAFAMVLLGCPNDTTEQSSCGSKEVTMVIQGSGVPA